MDVVGSEIGQKMRSAIKAKLTELGCYVDDELPDYVMVMVANKRTRSQMEDDLQLFLGDNTQLFVNWLHQVLKKLQEVTVTAPLKAAETVTEKKDAAPKEKKSKGKKDKTKKKSDSLKKSKKKDKEKNKKHEKKLHKSKKKSKQHESIRPNIPPLLMNMEKDSEPSITDVFAGQILKNHGIILDAPKLDTAQDVKPMQEVKRSIIPIIDPATIASQPETESVRKNSVTSIGAAPREEQIKEINEIEAKIQGLKQKLAEQLDSMSEDEDFLNIRTEAEELMNDFADDVLEEISQPPPTTAAVPPKSPPIVVVPETIEIKEKSKEPIETLPQIELKLPKRPIRERLGARQEPKKEEIKEKKSDSKEKKSDSIEKKSESKEKEKTKDKRQKSPERFTPEREPDFWPKSRSAKSRLGDVVDLKRKSSSDESEKSEVLPKRMTSKVSVLESRSTRATCASVVRVRPRPRVAAPASSLLMRAVADAHKSLCNVPPKFEPEPPKIKRAMVLPMRRCVDAQKIVIQVPAGDDDTQADAISLDMDSDIDKSPKIQREESSHYKPSPIIKKFTNTEYVPSLTRDRLGSRKDDTLIVETINIHNPTIDKDKSTQFIVTMDGFNPNAFLAKKLMTEGLLDDEPIETKPRENDTKKTEEPNNKEIKKGDTAIVTKDNPKLDEKEIESPKEARTTEVDSVKTIAVEKKRLSNTSDESDTQVIINKDKNRKSEILEEESPPAKKKRASPIVFDVPNKEKIVEKDRVRERTTSVSSDNAVTVTTNTSSHKYDAVPSLSQAERQPAWCRAFPACRFGPACAFLHPRCRFLAGCTRRGCIYSHQETAEPAPAVASHVVPAANYKSISTASLPAICKFYPNCVNPACHFFHPKPCRYGNTCTNKIECNFYHSDVQKYMYPV